MDGRTVALWVGSGFLAVLGLVRLMLARRNKLVLELRREAVDEQKRRAKDTPVTPAPGQPPRKP
jgi:hypothetical protein